MTEAKEQFLFPWMKRLPKKRKQKSKWRIAKGRFGVIRVDLNHKLILTDSHSPIVKRYLGIIPGIHPCTLVSINEAFTVDNPAGKWLHMFVDDVQFDWIWQPDGMRKFIALAKKFRGVIAPDFSILLNMLQFQKEFNAFRIHAMIQILQRKGIRVIPVVSWAEPETYDMCLDGYETGGIYAISTNGVHRNPITWRMFLMGFREMNKRLKPKKILIYGKKEDIPVATEAEIVWYENEHLARLKAISKKKKLDAAI